MFSKFIMFSTEKIKSKPIVATAITFTSGVTCGCLISSHYTKKGKNHSNNVLDSNNASDSNNISGSNNISDKIKQKITTVTDTTVDYVSRGSSNDTSNKIKRGIKIFTDETVDLVSTNSKNNYVYRVGDKIYKEFFSKPKP